VLCRQLYGLTEVCGGATVSTDDEVRAGAATCGAGGVFTRFRVVDEEGRDCAADVPGHILLQGPSCTPGYWGDAAATAALYVDGWMRTGDIGARDAEGRLRFIDRAKDILISGGINIAPAEIERVLAAFPSVREVAVIAARDPKFGETPAAILVADDRFDTEACIAFCGEHLSAYKVPRYLIRAEAPLPRLTSGKLDKQRLRADYAELHRHHARVR
jgi:fatty-acyl-CoA synthase